MKFSPLSLSFLSATLILILHPPIATADPLKYFCGTTNFTVNSTYQSNLNTLFTSLANNATNSSKTMGFASGTVGSSSNQISGLVLCRGDVNSSTCSSCISEASQDVQTLCPRDKGASIFYDYCMLHYSDQYFLNTTDNSPEFYMWGVREVAGSVSEFNNLVQYLLNTTSYYAAYNNSQKLAMSTMNLTTTAWVGTMYALVQCTPDLSDLDCASCLHGLILGVASSLSGTIGGRYVGVRCNVRYESVLFYEESPMFVVTAPATAPAPVLPTPVKNPPSGKKKNVTVIVLAIAIPVGLSILALCSYFCFMKRKTKLTIPLLDVSNPEEIKSVESLLISLSVIRIATVNFAEENKLGEGGFGVVYKGCLPDGREIAVKRLSETSGQGLGELKNELLTVAKLQHRNLVRLLGVCLEEQEKLIVYEYVPNNSLDRILSDEDKRQMLDWRKRQKIICGIARGLLYLHEDSQLKIIHRDLKASNVLLDAELNPKISDFGLARLFEQDQTQEVTRRVVGTYGYMAPEYAIRGQFSNKSDVFSYGVLVLEIISGKKNTVIFQNEEAEDLLSFVWEHWNNETITKIVDPSLGQNYPTGEVLRWIHIGLLCVQENPSDRPTMSRVAVMLSSETISIERPTRPGFCFRMGRRSEPVDPVSLNEVSISNLEPRF